MVSISGFRLLAVFFGTAGVGCIEFCCFEEINLECSERRCVVLSCAGFFVCAAGLFNGTLDWTVDFVAGRVAGAVWGLVGVLLVLADRLVSVVVILLAVTREVGVGVLVDGFDSVVGRLAGEGLASGALEGVVREGTLAVAGLGVSVRAGIGFVGLRFDVEIEGFFTPFFSGFPITEIN